MYGMRAQLLLRHQPKSDRLATAADETQVAFFHRPWRMRAPFVPSLGAP